MLGKRDIRDSIGYVTLGLFSNALIDELLESEQTPDTPLQHRPMLELAIDSIKEVECPGTIKRPRLEELVFQDYQEASTLRKTLGLPSTPQRDISDLLESLESLINVKETKNRKKNILKVIDFFCQLGRAAIVNSERPEEQVPPGVAQLAF